MPEKKAKPLDKLLGKIIFPYYNGVKEMPAELPMARPPADSAKPPLRGILFPYYNGVTSSSGHPAPPVVLPPLPPVKISRRSFITLFTVVGGLLALAPWVPFGTYLSSSVSGSTTATVNETIVLDANATANGKASGMTVNVNNLDLYPPNSTWIMTYPSSGNPTTDGENPNTFVKFGLIRLPKELGGANTNASAFVAFSKVCVHLWCSPNFNPQQCTDSGENGYVSTANCTTHELYECPCHGSAYSVGLGDHFVGEALLGPASVQPPPTNAIPLLTLTTDPSGNLQVVPPVWDVTQNGVIGYGRVTTKPGSGAFIGGYAPQ